MKKHIEEWDQKFSDLTSELVRAREEITSKLSNQAGQKFTPPSPSTSPTKFFRSNIKPRVAQILPLCSLPPFDQERKRKSNLSFDLGSKIPKISDEIDDKTVKKEAPDPVELVDKIISDKNILNSRYINTTKEKDITNEIYKKPLELSSFLSNSLENLLKNPLTNIKSRKRKSTEELDLK